MSKNLLILERSSKVLSFEKDAKGQYVLEGIFGEMGVKNKNGRVYDESEYLPQVEALGEKIKSSKLMGELDHPQNFDISLKNVSHVIEDISYDKETRQVRGRIRLLNTDAGKQAQALVEDGIPLHISSRAAGVVESDGKVKIKKLFTYDLVADPGFENAQLNRVNESFGFDNDENFAIFEIDAPIPGVDTTSPSDKYLTNENNATDTMEGVVKIEDFQKYSTHIKEQLDQVNATLAELKSLKEGAGDSTELASYVNKMSTKMNEMFSYLKHTVDTVNGVIENFNGIKEHNDHIVQNIKDLKGYIDHVAEQSDNGIQYIEDVAKKTNDVIEYNIHIAEHVDNLAQFGDHLSEGLNQLATYSEYLKGNIETVGQFGDYTAENVKRLKERLAGAINEEDRAKEIEDEINKMGEPQEHTPEEGEDVVGEEKEEATAVEEKFDTAAYKSDIAGKLDLLIESAQKQTADLNGDLHFLRFLPSDKRNQYYALNENVQAKIIAKAKQHTYTSQRDVEAIMESVITPVDNTPVYIKQMPEEYRTAWNNASQGKKNQIIAESTSYSFNTQHQIDNFWSTRDFRESAVQIEKIDESANASETATQEVAAYGVTNDYLDWFGASLAEKFRK